MWLLPRLAQVSEFFVRLYYRASRSGGRVPASGPVLLVANHPNTLLDPACVAWAAERPVRFLAKAPLFSHPAIGWLVRASGSIPVHRRQDDPEQMEKNEATFAAVYDALAEGSAVALFPEGVSHSEPALVPLRTGAARIALGAVPAAGAFPIIPLGLVFRRKERFRSDAHVIIGEPIAWSDLAARGAEDRDAVAELTARIDHAMRAITLNLARWEDERVVRAAEAIWAATQNADTSPGARVERLSTAADIIARARASGDAQWNALAREVRMHARALQILGLRALDVERANVRERTERGAASRMMLASAGELLLAALAAVLFWIPYRVTGLLAGIFARDRESVSTYRVLGGTVVFAVWVIVLAILAGKWLGFWPGLLTLVLAPVIAVQGLRAAEHWRWTVIGARQWFTVHRGDPRIAALRARQRDLARRLDEALASVPPEAPSASE